MSGLEVLGIIFCTMLIVGGVVAMIWFVTLVSVLNENDTDTRVRLAHLECIVKELTQKENKNGRQSIRKPNRRTRKG